jgi:hypothetical protein
MREFEDDLDQDVDNIIAQLKNQTKKINDVAKERIQLEKGDIEKFIIDNASNVVTDCVDMIQSLKLDVQAGGDSKLIESTATLVNAFTSAIDALSKLKLSEDKINAQKEIKQMDISAKLIANNENETSAKGVYISREELIKGLLDYKKSDVPPPQPPAIDI